MTGPAWLPVSLSDVEAVGLDAALVVALIRYRCAGEGWQTTHAVMAAETHLTEHRVRGAVRVLRDAGLVTAARADRFHAILTYRAVSAGHAENADSTVSGRWIPRSPETVDSTVSSLEETLEEQPPSPSGEESGTPVLFAEEPKPLRSVPSEEDLDAEFVRFWSLYPRREGKKAARAAYGRARRGARGQDGATVHQIAGGLRRSLAAWEGKEARFIPHPTTWLNQGRWEDEPVVETPAVSRYERPVRQADVVPENPIPDYEGTWVRPTFGGAS